MLRKPPVKIKKKSFHECTNFLKPIPLFFTFAFATTLAVDAEPVHFNPGKPYPDFSFKSMDEYVSDNIYGIKNLAYYYGDWDSNRVFIIDVDNMQLVQIVENTGVDPYGIDQQNSSRAYAITRQTESLTVIGNCNFQNAGLIPLAHKPRSTNFNSTTGLTLVAGADKVMTSIINVENDHVAKMVGYDEISQSPNFGGSLASDHPLWVGNQRFFLLDRADRQIQLWDLKGNLISILSIPTSVHHIFQSPLEKDENIFYAVVEGNQEEGISPSILRYKMMSKRMIKIGETILGGNALMGSYIWNGKV